MADENTYIYARLRALLGSILPVPNFNAAKRIIESPYRDAFADAIGATSSAGMSTSAKGKILLKRLEGLRTAAYKDSAGIPTIGYGNTYHPNGTAVRMGDTITIAQADEYLTAILPTYEQVVRKTITAPLSQNQFDALVCFVYNIGGTAFINGSVDDKLNNGDVTGALTAWASYNKARNPNTGKLEVVRGLTNRRTAEIELFNS